MTLEFDAIVIGGGITGIEAALDLGDQGFKVLLVDRDYSIGGKMIALSKVFPTLDCSSCITTPKMSAVDHHDNITTYTYTELKSLKETNGEIEAVLIRKPRYLIEEDCTGCRLCEFACPVEVPHEFEAGFGARRAICVPFTNAIPQVAVLNLDECIACGKCEKVCPTNCIDFAQEPEEITIHAGAAIIATGYKQVEVEPKAEYGAGKFPNVISGLDAERLLAPHGPYGRVLRPSDGKIPDNIAFIQCAGSRDKTWGVEYCSRVCCMYTIKQAMLLSGALPLADITSFYMDIRAFGKGYEQFYQNAKVMGIQFIKGKVARITEDEEHNLILRFENIEGTGAPVERKFDLVVLSLGLLPDWDPDGIMKIQKDSEGFIEMAEPKIAPGLTNMNGVFVAGAAAGPKDIVDSIVEAGSAAMKASMHLVEHGYCKEVSEPLVGAGTN